MQIIITLVYSLQSWLKQNQLNINFKLYRKIVSDWPLYNRFPHNKYDDQIVVLKQLYKDILISYLNLEALDA